MRRSLAWRVVLTTLGSGLIGAMVALAIVERVVIGGFFTQLGAMVISRFDPDTARACEAAPASWSLALWPSWQMRGYAYDARTGQPANPAAPALRADLVARLGPEPMASELDAARSGARSGAMVFRTAARPPCDLIQVTWRNPTFERRIRTVVGGSTMVSALLGSALGLLVLVIPLIRRIRRLRAAATRVGEATGYAPVAAGAGTGDELDALGQVLDRAHARIRGDARLLEDQRAALERHLASVAHDLRTPLTSLQIALEYAADQVEPSAREPITGALRDAVYLAGLTDNLRLASRLRSGWDPTDDVGDAELGEIVDRIAGRARILARRRGIALDTSVPDEPVRVRCNSVAVERALANLVDNAVAYGDPHGHVAVVLAHRPAGGFELEIRDDGPGVPPDSLARLGQTEFRSDHARQRDPRGSGLGLAITAELCRRTGWTLAFSALEPRGLLVCVTGDCAAHPPHHGAGL